MNHQTAMKDTRTPTTCTGEIVKGGTFDSQDFNWTKGTCKVCGTTIAMLGGFSHRFNYVISEPVQERDYAEGYQGREK